MAPSEQWPPTQWPPDWPDITDPGVLAAMAAVPRHLFVPPESAAAYEDRPLPIGHGQTISQPYMVARMTQALRLTPESRVLEIGTGSGYQTAILARLTPHVWSVEVRGALAEAAVARLATLDYRVQVKVGNGRAGWPEHAPYDAIVVTAAGPETPPALIEQLAEGGRLVIPLGSAGWSQALWSIEKHGGQIRRQFLGEVCFVPLVGDEPRREGDEGEPDATAARHRR